MGCVSEGWPDDLKKSQQMQLKKRCSPCTVRGGTTRKCLVGWKRKRTEDGSDIPREGNKNCKGERRERRKREKGRKEGRERGIEEKERKIQNMKLEKKGDVKKKVKKASPAHPAARCCDSFVDGGGWTQRLSRADMSLDSGVMQVHVSGDETSHVRGADLQRSQGESWWENQSGGGGGVGGVVGGGGVGFFGGGGCGGGGAVGVYGVVVRLVWEVKKNNLLVVWRGMELEWVRKS